MKNKKAQFFDPSFILIPIVILMVFFVFFLCGSMIWSEFGVECNNKGNHKLVSVDGRYDKDTGLFAGGSVGEKTLMFDNGLIITISENKPLRLGKSYYITQCENNRGRIWYKLK